MVLKVATTRSVGKPSENKCTCPGGAAATGAACAKHGAKICSSCRDGYRKIGSSCAKKSVLLLWWLPCQRLSLH
jgi:hypothetical protein